VFVLSDHGSRTSGALLARSNGSRDAHVSDLGHRAPAARKWRHSPHGHPRA